MNNIKFFFDSSNVSKMNHVSFDLSVLASCGGVQV